MFCSQLNYSGPSRIRDCGFGKLSIWGFGASCRVYKDKNSSHLVSDAKDIFGGIFLPQGMLGASQGLLKIAAGFRVYVGCAIQEFWARAGMFGLGSDGSEFRVVGYMCCG